ncbi:MAG TPA: FtsX-like permease family protein, partial [Fimbriimonadaceae bacterium]|nr:FtsX-like permease family protein [Fimbriimonadaceae bacterium]
MGKLLHLAGMAVVAVSLLACGARAKSAVIQTKQEVASNYRRILNSIHMPRVRNDLARLSSIGNRITGSHGEASTFEYVKAEFKRLGFSNIRSEPFKVTIPDPESRGKLHVLGQELELFPMWPNLVRTSTCDVTGKLIYGGDGTLEAFKGKEIQGSIVLMEFNSGARWRNAARLGASAIIFLEPEESNRSEAELKFGKVPLDFPRFYLPLAKSGAALKGAFTNSKANLTCRQEWIESESQNLLADLPGSDPSAGGERVLITANADAASTVPGIAPGAQSACSVAALLESARIWVEQPHRRPVTFMLMGAHMLSLQGAREFVDRRLQTDKQPLFVVANLDVSSGSPSLGAYGRGWFYEYRDEVRDPLMAIGRILRKHADELATVMNVANPRLLLTDAINQSDNRTWKNNIPGRFALDCEPMLLGGYNAISFVTIEDARDQVDTPFDTFDKINYSNLKQQISTFNAMLSHLLSDTSASGVDTDYRIPLQTVQPSAMRLTGGFSVIDGYVAVYDPSKNFVPDTRVVDALAVGNHYQKTLMGVRGSIVQKVNPKTATYRMAGFPLINSFSNPDERYYSSVAGFRLDPVTGDIDHAVDYGVMGAVAYPTEFELKTTQKTAPIVVFKCRSMDFYGLVDPQDLKTFVDGSILDAKTNGTPQFFGFYVPIEDTRLSSEIDDTACLFLPPGARFKNLLGSGMGEYRLILTNSTPQNEEGYGYAMPGSNPPATGRAGIAASGRFPDVAANTAQDIIAINQARLNEFAKYRIISPGISELQSSAKAELDQANAFKAAKDWGSAEKHARAAWGFALRAHPIVAKTTSDVVNGVIFYLFLIVPFSYFIERLFFSHRSLTKQLGTAILIFIGSFGLLRLVHPAFEIVKNPMMIFVAFVMGALSLIVILFILGKFESSLKSLKQLESGLHEIDIRRGSVAMAAFNLGVSNMRRRKARTLLTTLTLVVMTFIVLSFTSIVPDLQINELPSNNPARYAGLLIRNPGLDPLQSATYRQIANEFATDGTVVRRAAYYGADIGDTGVLTLQRASRVAEIRALVGFDPEESKVTRPQEGLLVGGRWFREGDDKVIILPQLLAETLKIESSDVGRATVRFGGSDYLVIGIINAGYMRAIQDLDGDGILAADFTQSRQMQSDTGTGNQAFRSFIRLDPSVCALIPASTALSIGADLRTVAVAFPSGKRTREALEALMPRLRLNLYASVENVQTGSLEVKQFSILQTSKGTGLGLVLIQLAIAAIFVLNTMIASVYERTKEISIFSSIGLAPNHIAMLFFAESLVYGVLGAVFGYFLAQVAAKIIVATGILPSLYLNFSSSSAVLSAGLVLGTVLASTIYPA